jgi:hypothetical protein
MFRATSPKQPHPRNVSPANDAPVLDAGLAIPNPDNPNRLINSPKWCYQTEPNALGLIQTFDTSDWETNLAGYEPDVKFLTRSGGGQRAILYGLFGPGKVCSLVPSA